MSAISIYQVAWVLVWTLIIGTCLFALWKGGTPERSGAVLILTLSLVSALTDFVFPSETRLVGRLVADGVVALGFLGIAVRYASLWLGGAMMFQAVQFSLQAYYFVTARPHDALYAVVNNVDTLGVLACLALGAITYRRRLAAWRKAHAAG